MNRKEPQPLPTQMLDDTSHLLKNGKNPPLAQVKISRPIPPPAPPSPPQGKK